MNNEEPERARDSFVSGFYRQRAGARKLRAEGKCNGENRPLCYATCENAGYCSEWKYTVRTLF